jgi:hypothetical protein
MPESLLVESGECATCGQLAFVLWSRGTYASLLCNYGHFSWRWPDGWRNYPNEQAEARPDA